MTDSTKGDFMQDVTAWLIVTYLRFCFATTRWQRVNQAAVEALWDARGEARKPIVMLFWHQRLHMTHVAWPKDRAHPIAVLSSLSKSGEVSFKANRRFGHHVIRGSSAKKTDPQKDKRGAQAFRELLRWLRDGNAVAMTPDGPRGPAQVMTEGSLKLAQMAGANLVILAQSTTRFITLKSWDAMRIPLPFSKGVIVWDVLPPPAPANEQEAEALRLKVGEKITALTREADRLLGVD